MSNQISEIDLQIKELSKKKEKLAKECKHSKINAVDLIYHSGWESNVMCNIRCAECNRRVEKKFKTKDEFKKFRNEHTNFTKEEYTLFDIISERFFDSFNSWNYCKQELEELNMVQNSAQLKKLFESSITYTGFIYKFFNYFLKPTRENYELLHKICPKIKVPDVDREVANLMMRGNYSLYAEVFYGHKTYIYSDLDRLAKSNHVYLKRIIDTPKKIVSVIKEGVASYNLSNKLKADCIIMDKSLFEELEFNCLPEFKHTDEKIKYTAKSARYQDLSTPHLEMVGRYGKLKVFIGNYNSNVSHFMVMNELDLQIDPKREYPRPSIFHIGEKDVVYSHGYSELVENNERNPGEEED